MTGLQKVMFCQIPRQSTPMYIMYLSRLVFLCTLLFHAQQLVLDFLQSRTRMHNHLCLWLLWLSWTKWPTLFLFPVIFFHEHETWNSEEMLGNPRYRRAIGSSHHQAGIPPSMSFIQVVLHPRSSQQPVTYNHVSYFSSKLSHTKPFR